MATIEPYETASGTRYMVRYRKPDNTQTKRRGFTTKRDAKDFAATVEAKILAGEFISDTAGRTTVGELAPRWLANKEQATAKSNYRMLESGWRVHVAPTWELRRIATITANDVETWIAAMRRDGKGATTVLRAHGVLSGILSDAVKARLLATNPAAGVDGLPRKIARRHVYLTADDVHRLADECGEHRVLVLVLAFCGLRWGEAIGLRVQDVHFLRRRLSVHENAVQLGTDHAVGQTKGKESRSVPVPKFVLDELSTVVAGKAPADLVFTGQAGGYLPRPKSAGGWFIGAVKRAGVQTITPHDLRHSAASLAVSAGANVLAVSRMLGHKDASVTLRIYADLFDADLDALAETLHNEYSRPISRNCAQNVPTTGQNDAVS